MDDLPSTADQAVQSVAELWRPMRTSDLLAVEILGNRIHRGMQEGASVFAERCALFPPGAWVAEQNGHLVGYALFHPWRSRQPPPLNTLLGGLPPDADTLYLHDIAVDPVHRSLGLAGAMMERLPAIARERSLPTIEVIALLGSANFWRRYGFTAIEEEALLALMAERYGGGACLMSQDV